MNRRKFLKSVTIFGLGAVVLPYSGLAIIKSDSPARFRPDEEWGNLVSIKGLHGWTPKAKNRWREILRINMEQTIPANYRNNVRLFFGEPSPRDRWCVAGWKYTPDWYKLQHFKRGWEIVERK